MFFWIATALLLSSIVIVNIAFIQNKDTYGEYAVFFLGAPAIAFFAWLWLLSVSFSLAIWLSVIFSIISAVMLVLAFTHHNLEKDYAKPIVRSPIPSDRPKIFGNRKKKEEYK